MGFEIVLLFCVLLLMSYIFDITASKTKIPSIILLLISGLTLQYITKKMNLEIPDLFHILPSLGTVGLILIVLEGSLELELKRDKMLIIAKSFIISLITIFILAYIFSYILIYLGYLNIKQNWINVLPLCVISSAIAIPTASKLNSNIKQFIIYESSLSDIFGVILFNFLLFNEYFTYTTYINFIIQIFVMFIISIVVTLLLAFALAHNKHHVKFLPIISTIILLYVAAKHFHLPALIFIMIFGISLKNIESVKDNFLVKKFNPKVLIKEVHKFTEITAEFAFLVRSIFFILFGFLININDVINLETLPWAIGVVILIFLTRIILLKIFRKKIVPIFAIAPRGLITILLFLSIPITFSIPIVNQALIIQVIILCTFMMMIGMIMNKKKKELNDINEDIQAIFESDIDDKN